MRRRINRHGSRARRRWAFVVCAIAVAVVASACSPLGPLSPMRRPGIHNSGNDAIVAPAPGYHVLFSDDFNLSCPTAFFPNCTSGRWAAYPDGWKDTSGNGTYDCSTVCSEHDGVLDLYVHTERGVHMVAAPEPVLAPGPHGYGSGLPAGRYTIAFKSDALPCYKTAWLLWPDSGVWPRDGEIDFPEGRLDGAFSAFMHRQGGRSGNSQDVYDVFANYTSWHVATIDWRPDLNYTAFFLDGNPIGLSTVGVPQSPMHWVIQTETATEGCRPADSTAGHVLIDFVQVEVPN